MLGFLSDVDCDYDFAAAATAPPRTGRHERRQTSRQPVSPRPLAAPAVARAPGAPRRGGMLVVAADTEPRNLNPAIIASNGVFSTSPAR
jgi:hypothetical protein